MAGYKSTFEGNVDYAYGRGVTDFTSKLQQGVSGIAGAGKGIAAFASQANSARQGIRDMGKAMSQLKVDIENATDPREIKRLTREFEAARKGAEKFRKELAKAPFDALEKGLGKVTKGLLSFNTGILSIGFNFLIDSIKRVYELQERWAHAIGGFNMKLGGMTKGLAGAQKAATQWSGTIRGLTNGSIEEGIQMFGEFTMAMGRTVQAGDGFSKLGMQISRGFGVGAQSAGQMLRVFENIGMSADDSAAAMKTSIVAANQAGIPVNMLAEDLSKSITYMARFGKEGQKTLVQGAAWARKYDIALEQLRNSVEGFDSFDDAAKSASKLNTAFGTMINSMDLMLEDDPAARLDMIRQQMLSQGLTYDKLTPKQRRYFSETMKLSDDQTAALLDAKNANESYTDFAAKAAAQEKKEADSKKMMQRMLAKTAQTLYAFGDAFDRVTKAIGLAIKPLTDVLGLTKASDKNFKGFGQVMEGITQTVIKFFTSLAGNDKWKSFMGELANDLKRAGSALQDFVMSGRAADMVGDIARAMKSFYVTVRDLVIKVSPMFRPFLDLILKLSEHIKSLAIAWAGLKVFNMVGGPGAIGKVLGGVGKIAAGGGGMMGKLGMAGAAGAAGYAIGGKGAGIGAAAGNLIGGMFGPIGMVAGSVIGGLIGKGVEKLLFPSFEKVKTRLESAQEDLAKHTADTNKQISAYGDIVAAGGARLKAEAAVRAASNLSIGMLEKKAKASKEQEITLSAEEAKMISSRARELTMFAKSTSMTQQMLEALGEGSKLTKNQLADLVKGGADYEKTLEGLRAASQKYLELEQAKLQSSVLGAQKKSLESQLQYGEAEVNLLKNDLQKAGGPNKDEKYVERFDDLMKYQNDPKFRETINKSGGSSYLQAFGKDIEQMKKLHPEQYKQLELTWKVRKKELENTEAGKKLNDIRLQYAKQEALLNLRAQVMMTDSFGAFRDANKNLKGDELMRAFIAQNADEISARVGDSGYRLLSEEPNFEVPKTKLASGGVVTRPTRAIIGEAGPEAVIPLSKMNMVRNGSGAASADTVVSSVADVHLDGQKVGRAIVKTTIQRRN